MGAALIHSSQTATRAANHGEAVTCRRAWERFWLLSVPLVSVQELAKGTTGMSPLYYRRGSIFWALILIAVGVIFLVPNFYPNLHPWYLIARYWPVLIIIWGLSKLVDYVHAHSHPEVSSPPLFSATEVILLLLILVVGTLLSHIILAPWHEWSREWGIHLDQSDWNNPFLNSYNYTQDLSQKVQPGSKPKLVVVNRRGDVSIQSSDSPEISAVVKETIRTTSEEEAKKLYRRLKLQLADENGQYIFQPDWGSLPNGSNNIRLDLTFRTPKSTSTEISTDHGDILLNGLQGDQSLTARAGDVHAAKINGTVRVEKSGGATEIRGVRGDVEISGRGGDVQVADVSGAVSVKGEFNGSVQFSNIHHNLSFKSSRTDLAAQNLAGKLDMELGSLEIVNLFGPLDLTTRQKDVSIQGFKQRVKIEDRNGNINLHADSPPAYPIEVDLKNGDILLALPPSSSFTIDAASHHGEVDSDFVASSLVVERQGGEPSIKGAYGKGGPLIRLTTTYGTIHLVRETAENPTPSKSPTAGETQVSLQGKLHVSGTQRLTMVQ